MVNLLFIQTHIITQLFNLCHGIVVKTPQRWRLWEHKEQKSDRRKLLLQLCGHTAFGRGLGAGDRRRSRHAQINKILHYQNHN